MVRVLGHVVRVLGNVVWGIRSRGQGTVLGHEVRVLGNMVRVKVQVVSVPGQAVGQFSPWFYLTHLFFFVFELS